MAVEITAESAGPDVDALVHKHVMGVVVDEARCRDCGWYLAERPEEGCVPGNCSMRPKPCGYGQPPPYTADLRLDHEVLKRVTTQLIFSQRALFWNALERALYSRIGLNAMKEGVAPLPLMAYYRTGDFSRAALKALGVTE
jgi:hypothetical protein